MTPAPEADALPEGREPCRELLRERRAERWILLRELVIMLALTALVLSHLLLG